MTRKRSVQWAIFVGALVVAALSLALYDTLHPHGDRTPQPSRRSGE